MASSHTTSDPVNKSVVKRKNKGVFVKGQSGNPKGRPVGALNKATIHKEFVETVIRTRMRKDAAEVLDKAFEMAKAGNVAMIKFLLDKIIPNPRPEDEGVNERKQIEINISSFSNDPAKVGAITVDGRVIPDLSNEDEENG